MLEKNDFVKRDETTCERTLYAAYQKDRCGVFLNYFCCTGEMLIVIEEACNYFSYTDGCGRALVAPQITQLYLENFGMSYVVRLSDGRFLLIDGGWEFEPDADRLFRFLKESSPYDKPVIAVDTHVFRVSRRIGLSDGGTVEAVEKDLTAGFAAELRGKAHHWLILHGRYVCTARKPKCEECGLKDFCREYRLNNLKIASK